MSAVPRRPTSSRRALGSPASGPERGRRSAWSLPLAARRSRPSSGHDRAPVREVWPIGAGTATLPGGSRRTSAPSGSGGGSGSPVGSCRSRTWMAHSRALSPASVQASDDGGVLEHRRGVGQADADRLARGGLGGEHQPQRTEAIAGQQREVRTVVLGQRLDVGHDGDCRPARIEEHLAGPDVGREPLTVQPLQRPRSDLRTGVHPPGRSRRRSTVDQASSMADSSALAGSRLPAASSARNTDGRCTRTIGARRWGAHGSVGRR